MKIYLVDSNHHAILSHEDWSQIALEIFYVKIQEIWLVVRILIHEKKIHIDGLDFRQKSQNLIFFFFMASWPAMTFLNGLNPFLPFKVP